MILDSLINIIFDFITWIISLIPQLPHFPQELVTNVETFISYIFQNLGFLSFFFNLSILFAIVPLAFTLLIVKYTIKLVVFIGSKVPMLMGG